MGEDRPDLYRIEIERSVERVMRRLPQDVLKRLQVAIDSLAADPKPPGCKRLAGYATLFRIRVGAWRITYDLHDQQLVVIVIEVSPRGGAYRRL